MKCQPNYPYRRITTEWYRVRGHNFDITNSTQFDQMFVENGQIFRSISEMVDRIFNRFIRREGHLEPFFAEEKDIRVNTWLKKININRLVRNNNFAD